MTGGNENISNALEARKEFIGHLQRDVEKNNQILEDTTQELDKLKQTIEDVKTLGKYPEHTSLIPLAKNIYMNGKIVHTGEYYIKKTVSPESYYILKSLEQTVNSLQDEVKSKEKDREKIEYASYQLEERLKLFRGEVSTEDVMQDEDLPKEIKSEKGIAVKVGEFYEIMEFED